jgi:membrane protein implicated in regulation of membrane protease activity
MRRVLKRTFIIRTALVFFGLTLLFDWLGIGLPKGGVPSTLIGWMVEIGDAAVEATIFTVLFFALIYCLRRFFLRRACVTRRGGYEADEKRQA